ncbi:hypothetical protein BP6252_03489 [Coleophoma cylindrospora]|uniref:N-acetyltransferase domain-containing protein n=1 Tax=Coleophoma cylindrospora TaxID=1849047 RepID=A0A3D8S7T0_9HELO|nr:hypothetical protein BP6252_03489 [Coleophoma cylindrospora]
MAAPTLHPDFELSIIPESKITDIWEVMEIAYADDELWRPSIKNCDPKEVHAWLLEHIAPRWSFPDMEVYQITEKSTGKLVAWTALQFPWKDRPLSEELRAEVVDEHTPPLPKGVNLDAFTAFLGMFVCTYPYGYDMEHDYRKKSLPIPWLDAVCGYKLTLAPRIDRKGTMVLPDYQKRGFGRVLTHHCNEISDKTGGRTFAPIRPNSRKLFSSMGYKKLGESNCHAERFGEDAERGIDWPMLRNPGGL